MDENGCPFEDYCIPEINPETGEEAKCPTTCPAGSIECPVSLESDEKVCYSYPQEIPDECQLICPVICENGKHLCHLGTDEDGCPLEDICTSEIDAAGCHICQNHGECKYPGFCPALVNPNCPLTPESQGCPPNPCSSDEQPCTKPNEAESCPDINYCIPIKDSNECINHCPLHCSENEIFCPKHPSPDDCEMPGICLPISNINCPITPESQGCPPITCSYNGNENFCTKSNEVEGCSDIEYCIPKYDENGCYNSCPCSDNEVFCPKNHDECEFPGHCTAVVNPNCPITPENQGCPPHPCSSGEQPCTKPNEVEGCPDINYCIPIKDSNECINYCPLHCSENEIFCPMRSTPDGCELPGTCHPISNINCPLTPESQGCPPLTCYSDENSCIKSNEVEGCPDINYCIPRYDENGCYHSCPADCGENEVICHKFEGECDHQWCQQPLNLDMNCPLTPGSICLYEDHGDGHSSGCKYNELICVKVSEIDGCLDEKYCIPKMDDDNECQNVCQVHCGNGEHSCKMGTDEDGCPLEDICTSELDASGCPICPMDCKSDEIKCDTKVDENGCKEQYCMPSKVDGCNSFCPLSCTDNEVYCPKNDGECDHPGYCTAIMNPNCPFTPESQGCPSLPCSSDENTCTKPNEVEGCPDINYCIPIKDECIPLKSISILLHYVH